MAHLSHLELRDFRAFRQASLEFDAHGLVLVTGPTNVGKSALLSALDVVAGISVSDDSYGNLLHSEGEQASIVARFRLTDAERVGLLGSTSETERLMKEGAAEWLEWEFTRIAGAMQALAVRTAWPSEDSRIIAELKQREDRDWEWNHASQPIAVWNGTLTTATSSSSTPRGVLEQAMNMPVIKPASDVLASWRGSYFHFKPLRQAHGRNATMHATKVLQADGSDLAQVLLHLSHNRQDDWNVITTIIQEIVPDVGLLALPLEGNQFEIAFRDRHATPPRHFNLKDLGTGVEQLLMALVVGATTSTATVVLEEPETGLHHAAQRALLNLLQQWSNADRVFIASTHSPVFLDWANARVVAVSRRGGVSTVEQVTDQRADVLRGLGVRLSDVLAAERILILEGPSDEQLMGVWFPGIIRSPRIAVIQAGGGADARHAQLLGDWIDRADQLGGRKLLYVRDRDELPQRLLDKLGASDRVFLLPCRELENLLLDFDAIAATLNRLREDQPALSAKDIEEVARQIAEELKSTVVLKRVCRDLEPHRFVDNDLRSKLAKQQAGEDELINAVVGRLPSAAKMTKTIKDAWQGHSDEVAARWADEWLNIVPGEDLLDGIWRKFLSRRYDKASDGLRLAQRILALRESPPEAIAGTIEKFAGLSRSSPRSIRRAEE